jgi:hypothetical protein
MPGGEVQRCGRKQHPTHHYRLDRKQLELAELIKKLGTFEVPVHLAPEVKPPSPWKWWPGAG